MRRISSFLRIFLLLSGSLAAQDRQVRHVLIFYEAGAYKPLPNLVDEGIRSALNNSPYRIEFHREFMETATFPDSADQQRFRNFYIRKYQDHRPDVIVAVGPSPLQFLIEAHQKSFPGVPVIFCLPNRLPGALSLDSDFTGVEADVAPAATLQAALQLVPSTKHVVVVGGTSPFDIQQEAEVKDQLKAYENRLDISFLTNLAMRDLLSRLNQLPSHSIILLCGLGRDAEGTVFSTAESGPMVVKAANAPVFSLNDRNLNQGEVGGDVSNAEEQGKTVGVTALRILNGEKPRDIAATKTAATYIFDSQALKRWGLKEKNLPPGSIVLNREPTVWEAFKWYIIVGISLIILQAVLISALLWHRARRKKAEADMATALEVVQESERRFRHVANTAPVMIWTSGTDKLCNYVNQTWLAFTGRSFAAELGDGWLENIHPDDVTMCSDTYSQAFDRHEDFTMQYRLRRHDGDYRWVLDRGVPRFNADSSFVGYIGSCVDITARKQAEEALAGIGGKLIAAQEHERTRIARELHDDINQQLAFLSVMLDQFRQNPPRSISQIRRRLEGFVKQVSDVSESVQALSHRLHSSKLEYLGVVPAMQSFCREFAAQHQVEVNFAHESVPENLPQEISLCLFRVAQAALVNALKHSGVKSFDVLLRGTNEGIQLSVHDDGVGFNPEQMLSHNGIGLISIRERTRFVNGTVAIRSKPNAGTTIEVEVPLPSDGSQSLASMAESQAANSPIHHVQ